MAVDTYVSELLAATKKHCAAVFFARLSEVFFFRGSADAMEGQGTITFLEHDGRCFGVTNGHVATAARDAALTDNQERTFFVALDRHQFIGPPIFISSPDNPDFPYDIAVFDLPREAILGAGKAPVSLENSSSNLGEGAMLLAVGFPGAERCMRDAAIMEHRLCHVIGTCVAATDRLIVLQEDIPANDRMTRFGGMSGGPIFSLPESGGYKFEGILFSGRGFGDIPDDQVEPNQDVWIYGFPFSLPSLLQLLSSIGSRLNE